MVLALTFCAFGLALSYIEGIPFTAPVLGKMPGVSMTYWVPLVAAIIGYLLLQVVAAFVGRVLGVSHRSWGQVLRNAVDDYLLLGLFVLVVYVHFNMKMWVPLINPHLFDKDYYAVDQALQPVLDSFFAIREAIARFLPAADVWYLAGYMSIFVLSFLSHALGDRRWHYHNLLGLLISQILGPLSYLIAPAVGPFIYEHGASVLATHTELRMYDVYQQARQGGRPGSPNMAAISSPIRWRRCPRCMSAPCSSWSITRCGRGSGWRRLPWSPLPGSSSNRWRRAGII